MKKRKYVITEETDKVVSLIYKGHKCTYVKIGYKSVDDYLDEVDKRDKERDEAGKRIEAQRAAMTPEERAGWDEADRAVFERWQDEANTNAILDGYEPEEGEDPDFNPFRKANEE
jgi:hypothetical protein